MSSRFRVVRSATGWLERWPWLWVPATILGVWLPLEFLFRLDAFLMYLRWDELSRLYALAWVLHALISIALGALLALVLRLAVRMAPVLQTRLPARPFEFVACLLIAVIVFRAAYAWLVAIGLPLQELPLTTRPKWALALLVAGALLIPLSRRRIPAFVAPITVTAAAAGAGLLALSAGQMLWSTVLAAPRHSQPAAAPTPETHPPIVLITIDTLAANHMSLYGYARPTTPRLDRIAESASVFERFYANSNFTTSAISSLVHGVQPWTHRALQTEAQPRPEIPDAGLVARLRRAGYHTIAVATNWLAAPVHHGNVPWLAGYADHRMRVVLPLPLWLEGWIDVTSSAFSFALPNLLCHLATRLLVATSIWGPADHFEPELAFAAARALLMSRDERRPPFVWVHLLPPHAPYATPAPFVGRFDSGSQARTRFNSSPPAQFLAGRAAAFPQRYVGRYDESIQYVDHSIGEFFDWLRCRGLFDDAVVVVSADHGESFSHGYGEHGGPLLSEDVIRIPLLIKAPRQRSGRRIAVLAQQIDVMPTLLELAGLPRDGPVEGRSLVPALRGDTVDGAIFSMNFEQNHRFGVLSIGSVVMIEGPWKYRHFRGRLRYPAMPPLRDALYDLAVDPGETQDLTAEYPQVAARMKAAIDEQLRLHGSAIR